MSSSQVGRGSGSLWQKTAMTVTGSFVGMLTSSTTPLQPMEEVSTHKGILNMVNSVLIVQFSPISQEVSLANHSFPPRRNHDDVTQAVIYLSPV